MRAFVTGTQGQWEEFLARRSARQAKREAKLLALSKPESSLDSPAASLTPGQRLRSPESSPSLSSFLIPLSPGFSVREIPVPTDPLPSPTPVDPLPTPAPVQQTLDQIFSLLGSLPKVLLNKNPGVSALLPPPAVRRQELSEIEAMDTTGGEHRDSLGSKAFSPFNRMPSLVKAPVFWGQDNLSHHDVTTGLTGSSFPGNHKAPSDVVRQSRATSYQEKSGVSSNTPGTGEPFQAPAVMDPVDSSRQPKGPVSLQKPSSIGLSSVNVGKGHSDYPHQSKTFTFQQPPWWFFHYYRGLIQGTSKESI